MRSRSTLLVLLVIVLTLALSACQTAAPEPTPTSEPTQGVSSTRLRVTNAGSVPIQNLTLLFPDEEVFFGDVPAGATTEYVDVKNGVYNYAAYRYELDGSQVTQPVIDWVGEEPKQGSFTYTIDFDPGRAAMQRIMQQAVTRED